MIENIKLGHSALSDKIYLYRHGKDPALALEKREAECDVMSVLIQYMMSDAPKGSEKEIMLGDQWYLVTVQPISKNEA